MSFNEPVLENVELAPSLAKGRLDNHEIREIKSATLDRLAQKNPILRHIMEVKVVQNERRNFINISIRKDYIPLIYMNTLKIPSANDVTFCFFLSDKLEPYVIITAVDHVTGKLGRLTSMQMDSLVESIKEFKKKFGIDHESYHYTSLTERAATDDFAKRGGVSSMHNKAHSSHFHLKMRIATGMLLERMPVCRLVNMEELRRTVEPVKYNYERVNVSWEEVLRQMREDVIQ